MKTIQRIAVYSLGSLTMLAITLSSVVASIWAVTHDEHSTALLFSGLAIMSGVARKIVNDRLDEALKAKEAERLKMDA